MLDANLKMFKNPLKNDEREIFRYITQGEGKKLKEKLQDKNCLSVSTKIISFCAWFSVSIWLNEYDSSFRFV